MKKYLVISLLGIFLNVQATESKQITLQVKEMTCQLCAYLVNKELRNVEGVISTKASIKDHLVKVQAKADLDEQNLLNALQKLHYNGTIIHN